MHNMHIILYWGGEEMFFNVAYKTFDILKVMNPLLHQIRGFIDWVLLNARKAVSNGPRETRAFSFENEQENVIPNRIEWGKKILYIIISLVTIYVHIL